MKNFKIYVSHLELWKWYIFDVRFKFSDPENPYKTCCKTIRKSFKNFWNFISAILKFGNYKFLSFPGESFGFIRIRVKQTRLKTFFGLAQIQTLDWLRIVRNDSKWISIWSFHQGQIRFQRAKKSHSICKNFWMQTKINIKREKLLLTKNSQYLQ